MVRIWQLAMVVSVFLGAAACADEKPITRIWLSHRSADPDLVVVNWESAADGDSSITFRVGGRTTTLPANADPDAPSIKRAEIRIPQRNDTVHYQVRTGSQQSAEAAFATFPQNEPLRIAVVADWQGRPKLDTLLSDQVHILATAGDHISNLHGRCGIGVKDCTAPFGELIDAYPDLFRSVRFMPTLGNHDREIRPRGKAPPAEPVYDVEATAYRKFFALPGDEWKWRLDLPEFGLRLIALDLNHISDQGTTWQTCHPFGRDSEQFRWFDKLTSEPNQPPFTVTLFNEKSGSMRAQEKGAWHEMFKRGTLAVTGFGYFAERAEVDGFSYYNTALGVGAKYPDAKSVFFESTPSYLLLQVTQQTLKAELKGLDGRVLESREFKPRQ
jgi:hypothetical protein